MRRLDIAIAGCGVAGLACATLLRAQGARVVVYDRLRTPAPLGSGLILQPVGLHVLDEIGIGARMRELGARIDRLYGKSGERIVLDVRYDALGRDAACGVSVHRGALFQLLYERRLRRARRSKRGERSFRRKAGVWNSLMGARVLGSIW